MNNEFNENITHSLFDIPLITEHFVAQEIDKMSCKKATGIDGLSCKVLKIAKDVIVPSITKIINMSIRTNTVPNIWKQAKVTPIFKSGDLNDVSNYRPISVLPILSKILERAVFNHFYSYLTKYKVICENQSGFRPKHSCCTALLKQVNEWAKNIDDGKVNGIVLIDLRKAFDTINHSILLEKLSKVGCTNNTVSWFKSYLANRQQKVTFKNGTSSSRLIDIGIPQGSILGPLLFTLYINDLPKAIHNVQVDMYADDTTFHIGSNCYRDLTCSLQSAMDKLNVWLDINKLVLNVDKTKIMLIGSRKKLGDRGEEDIDIYVKGKKLELVDSAKILGIEIDSHLNFYKHVDNTAEKVSRKIGFLRRMKPVIPRKVLSLLFHALVNSLFEYCSPVWSGASIMSIDKLFKLQK